MGGDALITKIKVIGKSFGFLQIRTRKFQERAKQLGLGTIQFECDDSNLQCKALCADSVNATPSQNFCIHVRIIRIGAHRRVGWGALAQNQEQIMSKSNNGKLVDPKNRKQLTREEVGDSDGRKTALARKLDQESRRISLRKNFCWLSDPALLKSVPILTFPKGSRYMASCDWSEISSGTSRSTFYLSGFGGRHWILWLSEWDDQGETSTRKIPVAGICRADVADSEDVCTILLSCYIKSLDYEFSPDYIEGSELISDDQLAEIIYKEES